MSFLSEELPKRLFLEAPSVSSLSDHLSSFKEGSESDTDDIDNNIMNNPGFVPDEKDSGNCTQSNSTNQSNDKTDGANVLKPPPRRRQTKDTSPASKRASQTSLQSLSEQPESKQSRSGTLIPSRTPSYRSRTPSQQSLHPSTTSPGTHPNLPRGHSYPEGLSQASAHFPSKFHHARRHSYQNVSMPGSSLHTRGSKAVPEVIIEGQTLQNQTRPGVTIRSEHSTIPDHASQRTGGTVLAAEIPKQDLTESWILHQVIEEKHLQNDEEKGVDVDENDNKQNTDKHNPEGNDTGATDQNETNEDKTTIRDNPRWDVFREYLEDTELYNFEACYKVSTKFLKLLFMLFIALLVLCCLVASKMSLLYITSNMNIFVAFKKYGIPAYSHRENVSYSKCGVPVCFDDSYKERDTVRWVWCLYLCVAAPYVFTFVRNLLKIMFKKKKTPKGKTVMLVLIVETVHTVGLFFVLFLGLPHLDITRALFALCGVGVFPSLLRIFNFQTWNKHTVLKIALDFAAAVAQVTGIATWIIFVSVHPLYYNEAGLSNNSFAPEGIDISGMCQFINGSFYNKAPQWVQLSGPFIHSLGYLPLNMNFEGLTSSSGSVSYNTYHAIYNTTYSHSVSVTEKPAETTPHSGIHLAETLPESAFELWPLPVGLLMVSIVWWENFLDSSTKLGALAQILNKHRKNIHKGRTKIYAIASFWKGLLLFTLLLCFYVPDGLPWSVGLKTLFNWDSFIQQDPLGNRINLMEYDWIIVFGVQAVVGLLCYWFLKLSVRGLIQVQCVSVPLVLSTPVTFSLLLWACHDCQGLWNIPSDGIQFWNCFSGHPDIISLFNERIAYVGFFCWIAELWTARHLWHPSAERLAKTDKIFVLPFYCGGFLEQSLAFNRRRNDKEFEKPEQKELPDYKIDIAKSPEDPTGHEPDIIVKRLNDQVPFIYVCATMWHENEAEMVQILKSLFRLDIDQSARRTAQQFFKIKDPDYYEFEAHVLFDDAFEPHADFDNKYHVNAFVKQFVDVINKAAFSVHKVSLNLHPEKYPTPYGGRLEYKLPGGNRLIIHLKDKMKIRHKKRWSQVMYMFYFLGHRLWAQKEKRSRKQVIADNTFILALDGDVDFKPQAVIHLVDLMKRDKNVAASCGRIHPVGTGPLVWYQKFEYAIAHWLAKCTEHVLGCVLCSPGCFSLFRGSALMDDNVMKTYCRRSTEARHHVQYDQGEDRWLCTLLLQQGFRVEYSAASDAMTYAPEGFNEFFNQRRRWTPSTFANILDLLTSARRTVQNNENISTLYMIYQGSLMASSILGPATIFLLIVGSFNIALGIPKVWALFLLLIPLVIFIIICIYTKSETQLMVAALYSTLLAVVQMVVLVGILRQVVGDGLCHPNTQLFLFIIGVFVLTGLLHPQEIFNLVHGFIYYLSIPSMYLILIIYSLCNLHVVSWGTREVIQTKTAKEQEQQKETAAAMKQAENKGLKGWLQMVQQGGTSSGKVDGAPITCGSLCQCLCCPRPGESPIEKQISQIQQQLTYMQRQLENVGSHQPNENPDVYINPATDDENETVPLIGGKVEEENQMIRRNRADTALTIDYEDSEPETERDELVNPFWIEDNDLGRGPKRELSSDEVTFWQELIQKYLFPLAANKEEQEKVAIQLKDLRNKAVFVFLLVDVLLIALIETLSMSIGTNESISIKWNCTDPISHEKKQVELDPVALTFILVFGIIMALQFLCMFSHRLMTWLQIVATTTIVPSKQENMSKGGLEPAQAIALAQEMQILQGADGDGKSMYTSYYLTEQVTASSSWQEDRMSTGQNTNLAKKLSKKPEVQKTFTMEQAFAKRFLALKAVASDGSSQGPSSVPNEGSRRRYYRSRGNIPAFESRSRSKSQHEYAMSQILRKREEIFDEEHIQALRSRYNFTDEDVNVHKRYMKQILPDYWEEPEPDYGPETPSADKFPNSERPSFFEMQDMEQRT